MKTSAKSVLLAAAAAVLMWIPTQAQAQGQGGGGGGGGFGGRGNMTPEERRQFMMDRYKEMLDVKSDDEWKIIEPRVQKVSDARMAVGFGGGMRMFGGGRRGGGGPGGDTSGNQQPRRANFGPQPSAAAQALQNALDSGASKEDIKAKLTAYREEREQKKAALEKAQDDLKKVLTVKQEAAAVLAGLLD